MPVSQSPGGWLDRVLGSQVQRKFMQIQTLFAKSDLARTTSRSHSANWFWDNTRKETKECKRSKWMPRFDPLITNFGRLPAAFIWAKVTSCSISSKQRC